MFLSAFRPFHPLDPIFWGHFCLFSVQHIEKMTKAWTKSTNKKETTKKNFEKKKVKSIENPK